MTKFDMDKYRNLKEEDLPEWCYGLLLTTKEIIIIKKGESGYYETDFGTGFKQEFIDRLNEKLGVTPEEAYKLSMMSMRDDKSK